MDILLTILGIICIIIGLIGCFLPILPGPPLSYLGLLFLHWTSYIQYSNTVLWVLGIAMAIVTILDYILPVWATKLTGGSRYASWGATLGIIAGIFILPPIGLIVAPFVGAFIGELMVNDNNNKALKVAFGAFIGFLFGTGLKLIVSVIITFYFFKYMVVAFFN